MYTIISGTNRLDSYTEKIANTYKAVLKEKGIESNLLSLKMLNVLVKDAQFLKIEESFLKPAEKFIFIIPEYNGSYPGVLKCMIDNSNIKEDWWWKKALLTGVSSGRAGNLRGMDHLTGTLQYLKMIVHPNKLPISIVDTLFDETGVINHCATSIAINDQLEEYINF